MIKVGDKVRYRAAHIQRCADPPTMRLMYQQIGTVMEVSEGKAYVDFGSRHRASIMTDADNLEAIK